MFLKEKPVIASFFSALGLGTFSVAVTVSLEEADTQTGLVTCSPRALVAEVLVHLERLFAAGALTLAPVARTRISVRPTSGRALCRPLIRPQPEHWWGWVQHRKTCRSLAPKGHGTQNMGV